MTGPDAWARLRDRLATADTALRAAEEAAESARAAVGAAGRALVEIYVGEEPLDARLAREQTDAVEVLELYRHGHRVAGLDRLRQDAAEGLSRLELELVSIETISAFTLARAFVDTVSADLADLLSSYETVDDEGEVG